MNLPNFGGRVIVILLLGMALCLPNRLASQCSQKAKNEYGPIGKGAEKARYGQWEPPGRRVTHIVETIQYFPRTTVLELDKWSDPIFDYSDWRAEVGRKIQVPGGNEEQQFKDIFSYIFDQTASSLPAKDWKNNKESAMIAKYAAFVYYLDIHKDTATGSPKWQTLNSGQSGLRDTMRLRAMKALCNIEYDLKSLEISLRGPISDWSIESFKTDNLQDQSKALIMALQAYDLLKAAGSVDADWMEQQKLRLQLFARDVYKYASEGVGAFNKENNHSLMSSAALGMAAIVLDDVGHRWYKHKWHPQRWANRANYEIQHTMFRSSDPMTSDDGSTGYAEGPYYYLYAFENLLPFFNAYYNYFATDHNMKYFRNALLPFSYSVQNHLYNGAYKNIMDWYASTLMPGGFIPPTDASLNYYRHGYLTGCYYDPWQQRMPFNWRPPHLSGVNPDQSGTGMLANYIAIGTAYQQNLNPKDRILYNAGAGIMQNAQTGDPGVQEKDRIYLLMQGERAEANNGGGVDIFQETIGKGHEHPDLGSFIVTGGEHQLIIDPGYLSYKRRKYTNQADDHNVLLVRNAGSNDDFKGPSTTDWGNLQGFMRTADPIMMRMRNSYNYRNANFYRTVESYATDDLYFYSL